MVGNSISRGTKKFVHPVLDPLAITTGHMRAFLGNCLHYNVSYIHVYLCNHPSLLLMPTFYKRPVAPRRRKANNRNDLPTPDSASSETQEQRWATLIVMRARFFLHLYQGARLLIHVYMPFTLSYSIPFLLKEIKVQLMLFFLRY